MKSKGEQGMRRRAGAVVPVVLAALVLLLGGCGPGERDLPERPALAELQVIDLCALAPPDQVTAEVSDALGRGWMRSTLGECWFTSPSGAFWLKLAPDELPDQVAEDDPEVPVEDVDGGRILDTTSPSADCLERTLVSDADYILQLNGPVSAGDGTCEILDGLGELVLANLAADVPTIDWPDGTSGTVDLCAAVEEHGIGEALGIEDEVTVRSANHFDCAVGASWDVEISFDTRVSLAEGSEQTPAEVAGRPALSTDGGCTLAIDLGQNPVLADMIEDGRDTLDVSTDSADVDCADLPAALEGLVGSLAH
ncbi:hypothetical protein [Ruania zhangjianzhongii]|uniref:hypothetical protein n=1 Tax=Ruania zhangjianzhongii TaxID=2603206 RepID=UPI0011CC99CE|nr:hypothetical protein [Ruania zhangjianzhongii]